MEDQEIVQLIWDRQEHGLRELSTKYNGYCYSVSYRIVHDAEDARECVHVTVSVQRKITDDLRQKAPQCPRPLRRDRIPGL